MYHRISVLIPVLVRVPEYLSTSTSTSTSTITLVLMSTSTVPVQENQYSSTASTSTEYEYPSPVRNPFGPLPVYQVKDEWRVRTPGLAGISELGLNSYPRGNFQTSGKLLDLYRTRGPVATWKIPSFTGPPKLLQDLNFFNIRVPIEGLPTGIFITGQEDRHGKGFYWSSTVFTGQGLRARINSWIELELIFNSIQFSMNWIGIELKDFELELNWNWKPELVGIDQFNQFIFNSTPHFTRLNFFVCHIMEIVV